ncbi:hypothetical protein OIV83_005392 [Microbotryomycetes sp. JL201]|nr:hypothetical protein OIV83_005392 [Microbotryomycetes sp. JL201]
MQQQPQTRASRPDEPSSEPPPLVDSAIDVVSQALDASASAFKIYVVPLIPSPSLILQSLGFVIVLSACITTSILAWSSFYAFTRATSLGARERVWLQYGKFQAPHATIDVANNPKIDLVNVPYDVTLDLVVPVSERNLDVGNFMVELDAVAAGGQSIANVSRPATLVHPARNKPAPPPPPPPRKPSIFALLSPNTWLSLILGPQPPPEPKYEMDETQRLRIPLLEHRLLSARRLGPAKWLHVQVGRDDAHSWFDSKRSGRPGMQDQQRTISSTAKDCSDESVQAAALAVAAAVAATASNQGGHYAGTGAWAGGRGELQIYESWLNFDARLTGLKYALYYHPILSFLVFVTMFTSVEMLGALAAWACWSSSSSRRSRTSPGYSGQSFSEPRQRPPPPSYSDSDTVSTRIKREDDPTLSAYTTASTRESRQSGSESTFARAEQYERDMFEQEQERQRRLRGLAGIVGMSDVGRQGGVLSSLGDDDDDASRVTTETETETEGESSSWEGVEGEQGQERVKDEDDEGLTMTGSATTRATRSTLGPSVAGASTSARTSSSAIGLSAEAVMRERRRAEQEARGGDD